MQLDRTLMLSPKKSSSSRGEKRYDMVRVWWAGHTDPTLVPYSDLMKQGVDPVQYR